MAHRITFFCLFILLISNPLKSQITETAKPDYSEYGKKASIGISILDGFGIPARLYKKNNVFELGLYAAGILFVDENTNEILDSYLAPMFGAGYTYFGDRFLKTKRGKEKIRAHGIALRVNQIIGDYSTTIPSLSWAQETFRKSNTKRSFLFELGIQYGIPHYEFFDQAFNTSVGIRLRCQWNFFLK